MREEYDFTNARKNLYKKVTIKLKVNIDTINYFKDQSVNSEIPYKTPICLYPSDCKVLVAYH